MLEKLKLIIIDKYVSYGNIRHAIIITPNSITIDSGNAVTHYNIIDNNVEVTEVHLSKDSMVEFEETVLIQDYKGYSPYIKQVKKSLLNSSLPSC